MVHLVDGLSAMTVRGKVLDAIGQREDALRLLGLARHDGFVCERKRERKVREALFSRVLKSFSMVLPHF